MHERLQKILSAQGICSRRKAEEYIEEGLVKVNGVTATLGQKADPEKDRIEVDGKVLLDRAKLLYYLLNKPEGVVTHSTRPTVGARSGQASNVQGSRKRNVKNNNTTVCDLLPLNLQGKIYPVGRLDKDSSGLLLLTNDGPLAYRLTHPKFFHEKEYEVESAEPITDGQLHKLEMGVMLDGKRTKKAKVSRITQRKFRIALTEGRNRQIRRMVRKVGSHVESLRRTRIVTLSDRSLNSGKLRALKSQEVQKMLRACGLV